MEVILLEKIRNLGDLGDSVKVKAGFGRNYLIPFGKAVMASKDNVARFESRRAELENKAQLALTAAKERAEKLNQVSLMIEANASEEGKLYGSVGTIEIAKAIEDQGITVEKREIVLPMGTIHEVGEFDIEVILHSDVIATVKLQVTAAK